ncbi:MAG: hypothetical protein RLZZ292_1893, partial [Bacteroidota bacterium]
RIKKINDFLKTIASFAKKLVKK